MLAQPVVKMVHQVPCGIYVLAALAACIMKLDVGIAVFVRVFYCRKFNNLALDVFFSFLLELANIFSAKLILDPFYNGLHFVFRQYSDMFPVANLFLGFP